MSLRDFVYAILVVPALLAGAPPAFAQDELSPASQALLDRFAERAVNADYFTRNRALENILPEFVAAAHEEPSMALAYFVIETQVSIERSDAFLSAMRSWMGTRKTDREHAVNAVRMAIAGLRKSDPATPPTGEQLYSLAEDLDRLVAAGIGLHDIAGEDSSMFEFMSGLVDAFKAGLAAADMARGNTQNTARDVRDILAVAASVNPYIAGPTGVMFAAVEQYNVQGLGLITQGVGLVADGFGGEFDAARFDELSARLDEHLRTGPWTSETGEEVLKKWAENIPVVGKVIKALWPDLPDTCQAISCDCDGGGYLNIGDVARNQCFATQSRILDQCRADQTIRESCDPTASGPNANPKPS